MKPFLRWAGGKTWLINHIDMFLPKKINNYYEPFLGGGAMFLHLKSKGRILGTSYLSDTNEDLINTYEVLRDFPHELFAKLKKHENTEEFYYNMRNSTFIDNIGRASRFLYLNRTSFNGIYRVNKNGNYNVPFGHRKLTDIYDYDHLLKVSMLIQDSLFAVKDFKLIAKDVAPNDLVFLDPPYTVAHENNGFIQYNQSLFSWENQVELSKTLTEIKNNKANFIMTNASHSSIEKLYNDKGKKNIIVRSSTVGGTGARRTYYNELIYTNY